MSPKFKALTASLLAFALSACGTQEVVVKHDTLVLAPQDSLLLDCPVTAPPTKAEYEAMTAKEKEKALSVVFNQQTINLGLCNKDKAGLRAWKKAELARQGEKQ
jgi:uncharacterized protein YcfL